jgi:tetratricopeptide (TPR) repeat protein
VATGEVEWGLRLVIALGLYFFALRLLPEGLERLARLLALPGVERFPRLRNFGKFWEADFTFEIAPSDCGRYYVAWKLFEDANDRQGMLYVAHRLGFNETDRLERERWAERAVELARETGQMAVLAGTLSNLADIVRDSNCTYARALHKEAMHLFESSGDEENAIWSLSHQADVYRDEGNRAQAREFYADALTRFRKRGFSHGVASCLFDLGGLEFLDGRLQEASRLYRESLRLYGPENPTDLPRGIESLAEVAIHCAQLERALVLAGASAGIRERFHVRTRNPARRAEVAAKIDAARKDAGPAAAVWSLKGWNMSLLETIEYAEQDGDETWISS